MAGNTQGGLKAATTNKSLYGSDYYARIGKMGGSRKVSKGFSIDNRTRLQKLMGVPSRASLAGAKGGRISRRTKVNV